jgi:acyl-CoA synthetase (AMP-forming)/AMP-acid ligase II
MVFERNIQTWIQSRVARFKHLRGGVAVIGSIPKRFASRAPVHLCSVIDMVMYSAAGKLLRRELRERAKKEMEDQGVEARPKL